MNMLNIGDGVGVNCFLLYVDRGWWKKKEEMAVSGEEHDEHEDEEAGCWWYRLNLFEFLICFN